MHVRVLRGAVALLLLACVVLPAPAQTRAWAAAAIANQPAASVHLLDAQGESVAVVRRELVQQLLAVLDRIQRPGGFAGELIVTDGKHPNAFAVSARGRSIIGITAPMLELLGDDLDAYAALLGHEIAHHVRQHGAERRSREQALGAVSAIVGLILGAAGVQGGLRSPTSASSSSAVPSPAKKNAKPTASGWNGWSRRASTPKAHCGCTSGCCGPVRAGRFHSFRRTPRAKSGWTTSAGTSQA